MCTLKCLSKLQSFVIKCFARGIDSTLESNVTPVSTENLKLNTYQHVPKITIPIQIRPQETFESIAVID